MRFVHELTFVDHSSPAADDSFVVRIIHRPVRGAYGGNVLREGYLFCRLEQSYIVLECEGVEIRVGDDPLDPSGYLCPVCVISGMFPQDCHLFCLLPVENKYILKETPEVQLSFSYYLICSAIFRCV